MWCEVCECAWWECEGVWCEICECVGESVRMPGGSVRVSGMRYVSVSGGSVRVCVGDVCVGYM